MHPTPPSPKPNGRRFATKREAVTRTLLGGVFGVGMVGIGLALIDSASRDTPPDLAPPGNTSGEVLEERESPSPEKGDPQTSGTQGDPMTPPKGSDVGDAPVQRGGETTHQEEERERVNSPAAPSRTVDAREGARAAAQTLGALASAMTQRASLDATERALNAQGFALVRSEPSRGATGLRLKARLEARAPAGALGARAPAGAPGARAPSSALLEGEIVFEGNDSGSLSLEHARLVYAARAVDLETLRADLGLTLTDTGWEQGPGPRGESTLWRHAGKGLLVSLRRYAADEPKPWDDFPSEGVVVSVQRDHE